MLTIVTSYLSANQLLLLFSFTRRRNPGSGDFCVTKLKKKLHKHWKILSVKITRVISSRVMLNIPTCYTANTPNWTSTYDRCILKRSHIMLQEHKEKTQSLITRLILSLASVVSHPYRHRPSIGGDIGDCIIINYWWLPASISGIR